MFTFAESDPSLAKSDAKAVESQLRTDLLKAQYSRLKQGNRALLIVIAGIDGVGKGASICLLNEWMDARHIHTLAFDEPAHCDEDRPFLWRYWRRLPAKGQTAIVFGSWYAPMLEEACGKSPDQKKIQALSKVIRQFESTLAQNNVQILKLWYHLSQEAQNQRTQKLLSDPATAWQVRPEDLKVNKKFSRLRDGAELALSLTSESHAPWVVIPAANKEMRDISTGRAVLTTLRRRRIEPIGPFALPTPKSTTNDDAKLASLNLKASLDDEKYDELLPRLQGRLAHLARDKAFEKIPLVLAFEGQDAAGKGGAIRRITHALDPRQYRAIPISAPTDEEHAHPHLWRFWRRLPRPGKIVIFDRSWYGRVLVERVEGYASQPEWQRAYEEINQFESQLVDSGAVVLKFWLAVGKDEQLKRFREREASTFKSFKITPEDWRNRKQWNAYEIAAEEMFERTSTPECPWHVIPANDKRYARITILEQLVSTLEKAMGVKG